MEDLFKTIKKRTSLYEEIASIIKESILTKQHNPGDVLPSEGALSEQFGVSRNVIREAFRSLQSRGFLEIRRGKNGGAYILDLKQTTITENLTDLIRTETVNIDHLSRARSFLEPEVVRLASLNASPNQLDAIEHLLKKFDGTTDGEEKIRLNCEFHRLIGRSCGNSFFSILIDVLMDFTERFVLKLNPFRKVLHRQDEHQIIFEAIKNGDHESAEALARKHVDHMGQEIKRLKKNYMALINRQIQ